MANFASLQKQIGPCDSTGRELSFEWSHQRISSTGSKASVILQNSTKHSGSERVKQFWFVIVSAFDYLLCRCSWFWARHLVFTGCHQNIFKLSLLLSFYFHVALKHLKTFIRTNLRFKRVLRFAVQDGWISRLLRDAEFSWRPGNLF